MQVRKADLIQNTDSLSLNLKESIDQTNALKQELSAVDNLVQQYELANKRVMDEMEV